MFGRRRRSLLIGVGAGAVIIVVALLVLASVVSKIFGNVGGGLNKDELGLNGRASSSSSSPAASPAGSLVKPTKATVFSPDGEADNPGQAGKAIDGDPSTAWQTDIYPTPSRSPASRRASG